MSESLPPSGAVRYVSANGSSANSGTSPDFPWDLETFKAQSDIPAGTTIRFNGIFYNSSLPAKNGLVYAKYGDGATISSAENLKIKPWTDRGGNVWSCPVNRATGKTGCLRRNDVWFLNTDMRFTSTSIGKQSSIAALAQNGDWFQTAGSGAQTLHIYNSGGNPATDSRLQRLEYGNQQYTLQVLNVDDFQMSDIGLEDSVEAAIRGLDSHNIKLLHVNWEGHRTDGAQPRISVGVPFDPSTLGRQESYWQFEECSADYVGYTGEAANCCFFPGGQGGLKHGPRLLEIIGGHYGPHCGNDIVTNNGMSEFLDGGSVLVRAVGVYFENAFGENCWDSKTGDIEVDQCEMVGNGIKESPAPMTIQNFTLKAKIRRTIFRTFKNFPCLLLGGINAKNRNHVLDMQQCTCIHEGTGGNNSRAVQISPTDRGGATPESITFKDNDVFGAVVATARATCIRVKNLQAIDLRNNRITRRGCASHINLFPGAQANISGCSTTDPGGLIVI